MVCSVAILKALLFPNHLQIFIHVSHSFAQWHRLFSKLYVALNVRYLIIVMHQSFVVTAITGPGNSGAFNFSVFKALHCGDNLW